MSITKENKKNLINEFSKNDKDTGSTGVQIAVLTERIKKLEHELKSKKKLEKKFNQDINDLNQETQSLVDEIEKWQM